MAEQQKKKGVRTRHAEYTKNLPLWQMCNDAAEGEQAIHAAGETYLPKLADEKAEDYKARKGRTPFFNATWRTISGLKGMMFRKPPVFELPDGIKELMKDVDMAGTPMEMFAQELAEEQLTPGRVGVLVDRPPMPVSDTGKPLTVAQAEMLGLRPSLQKYEAASIINWKFERVGNAMMLTMVVLAENATVEGDDEFQHKTEERYRVLDLVNGQYRQRVFEIKNNADVQIGSDIYPQMNSKPMGFIPFFFIGVNDLSPSVDSPPLLDLVNMNIHHYQVSADYEHGCHFSGLPTPIISGHRADEGQTFYIGGAGIICLDNPEAKGTYMEVEGDFEALRKNKDDKKAEMAVLGARMLEGQKASVESHETLIQRTHGEQSQLAAMASVLSMALTKILTVFADWAGSPGEVKYEINTDFIPAGMTAQELTALVAAWQAGLPGTSDQNVYRIMQEKEMADSEVTFEEEQERINSRQPAMVAAQ